MKTYKYYSKKTGITGYLTKSSYYAYKDDKLIYHAIRNTGFFSRLFQKAKFRRAIDTLPKFIRWLNHEQ